MDDHEIFQYIQDMPDEVLGRMQFAMPWQYDEEEQSYIDPDGFRSITPLSKEDPKRTRDVLQTECWEKFHRNPHINTSVRGVVGRLTGMGWESTSEYGEIEEVIQEIELDPRNRLYNFWPKFVARAKVEGELFLLFTCHADGFIEVDFLDPIVISGGGADDSGIIFHPKKSLMPLFYNIEVNGTRTDQIPSIFIARYPELVNIAAKDKDFDQKFQIESRNRKKKFNQFRGYYRFIVAWDMGFMTKRAISHLRTTIEWLNHYEQLKKYEIDHKRSSGAYLWIFKITEPRAYKQWLALSEADRRKTGIMAKKTPGGSLILPPGIELDVKNPSLTKISEQDTDILDMVGSGLNEPEDVMIGRSRSTYSSVKASRGPMSDRISDEIAYFERFLRHDFWGSIFFLKSKLVGFREYFKVREAVRFKEGKDGAEPIFENRRYRPEQLIDFNWPVSETIDFDARARGLLGVKHGPVADTVGVPNSEVAKRLGFGGYAKMRLRKATEDEKFPELIYSLDAEMLQETAEAEPSRDARIRAKKQGSEKDVKSKPEEK